MEIREVMLLLFYTKTTSSGANIFICKSPKNIIFQQQNSKAATSVSSKNW